MITAIDKTIIDLAHQIEALMIEFQPLNEQHKAAHSTWLANRTGKDMEAETGLTGEDAWLESARINGVLDVERAAHAVMEKANEATIKLLAMKPATMAGYAAKFRAVKAHSLDHFWRETEADADWDVYCLRKLIDEIIAFGGAS